MALLRKRRHDDIDPFSDLLFNAMLGVVLMFALAFVSINPKAKTGVIDAKAEFLITTTWPDNRPVDIDTWVQDGGGKTVWFRTREAGLMHLDRDDRGMTGDVVVVDGKEIVNPLNQEVVTIRGIAPGEYIVNAHYYESKDDEAKPVPVTVSVVKVNPRAEVVFHGSFGNVNALPRKLVENMP